MNLQKCGRWFNIIGYEKVNKIDLDPEDLFSTKIKVRIIKVLASHKELNISSLIEKTQSNHAEIVKNLEYLCEIGLLQEKRYGRIRIIRLRDETFLGKILVDFFQLFKVKN